MAVALAGVAAVVLAGCGRESREPAERQVDPSAVAAVPTLDSPIPAEKSAVWCAAFEVAWDSLSKDVMKGPPQVRGAEEICRRLNGSVSGEGDLPKGTFYAAAGWIKEGIRERIKKEMASAFPSAAPPDLGGGATVAVAFAHLEAGVKFGIPFFESREPLRFKDSAERETTVISFGIRKEDDYAYEKLRSQVEVLFAGPRRGIGLKEFAIDPCKTSNPTQMVLARVSAKASLAETVASVEEKIRGYPGGRREREMGPSDVLLIPNVTFNLIHHFKELEGIDKPFLNPGMEGNWISDALQSIRFRLDRSGAELRSEAKVITAPIPSLFIFDRPFLVYLKKRGGGKPFFALWIDGAGILQEWAQGKDRRKKCTE